MVGHFIQEVVPGGPRPVQISNQSALAQLMGTIRLLRGFDREPPLALSCQEVDRVIPIESAGRYVLGHRDSRGSFHTQFVGRSESNLNAALKEHVGMYKEFKVIADAKIPLKRSGGSP